MNNEKEEQIGQISAFIEGLICVEMEYGSNVAAGSLKKVYDFTNECTLVAVILGFLKGYNSGSEIADHSTKRAITAIIDYIEVDLCEKKSENQPKINQTRPNEYNQMNRWGIPPLIGEYPAWYDKYGIYPYDNILVTDSTKLSDHNNEFLTRMTKI